MIVKASAGKARDRNCLFDLCASLALKADCRDEAVFLAHMVGLFCRGGTVVVRATGRPDFEVAFPGLDPGPESGAL